MYVIFEPIAVFTQEEDGWTAVSPNVEGAISEGDTLGEARANIREAIEGILQSILDRKVKGGINDDPYVPRQGEIVETVEIDQKLQVAISIKGAREKRGLNQSEMAKLFEKNQQDISRYEKGTVIPSADIFLKMVRGS